MSLKYALLFFRRAVTAMDVALVDLEVFVKEKNFDDGFSSRIPDDEFCGIAESEGSSRTCLCECYKKVRWDI